MSDEKALAALKPIFAQIDVGNMIDEQRLTGAGLVLLDFFFGDKKVRAYLYIDDQKSQTSTVICNGRIIAISRETALELYEIYRDLCIESMLSEPKLLTA